MTEYEKFRLRELREEESELEKELINVRKKMRKILFKRDSNKKTVTDIEHGEC